MAMACPYCDEPGSRVIRTTEVYRDDTDNVQKIRRRRRCAICKARWTTIEIPEKVTFRYLSEE